MYLIHLAAPVCPTRPARHYLGSTVDLDARIAHHQHGTGAKLLAAANDRRIPWTVVRTWDGGRGEERALKNQHNAPRLCPTCQGSGQAVTV